MAKRETLETLIEAYLKAWKGKMDCDDKTVRKMVAGELAGKIRRFQGGS